MNEARAAAQPTLFSMIEAHARLRPASVAVEWAGGLLSYRDFAGAARTLAADLAGRGIGTGARVALLSPNSPFHLLLLAACSRLGAAAALLNWRLADAELAACVERAAPGMLFAAAPEAERARRVARGAPVQLANEAPLRVCSHADAVLPQEPCDSELPLTIVFTGGSTGRAKAALISQRALLARAASACADFALCRTDVFVAWSPFFHVGATDQAIATLMLGGKVFVQDGFDAAAIVGLIEREYLGRLVVVPGTVRRLIEALRARPARPRGIKSLGAMADLIPARDIAELTALLSTPFTNTFGSTETGLSCASAATIAVATAPARLPKMASAFCSLRLVDAGGAEVPPGTAGELTMRGPTLFSGYLGDEKATRHAFRDGWYHTGDVCIQDAGGTIQFVDRLAYLIKCGGENIYPAEIERTLLADARFTEAVVVRQRDADWGEVPVAFVSTCTPDISAAAAADVLRDRIARYKQPRRIIVVPEGRFPRGVNGKVLRPEVERWLEDTRATTVEENS